MTLEVHITLAFPRTIDSHYVRTCKQCIGSDISSGPKPNGKFVKAIVPVCVLNVKDTPHRYTANDDDDDDNDAINDVVQTAVCPRIQRPRPEPRESPR